MNTTTHEDEVPGREGHRGHHDRPVPAAVDGLRRLRGRPGLVLLEGQLPPEVRRRRRAGRHRVDAEPHQGPPDRLRQPPQQQHRRRRLRHRPLQRHHRPRIDGDLSARHRHRSQRHQVLLPGLRQRRPSPHPRRRSRVQPPPPPRQPPQLLRRRHVPDEQPHPRRVLGRDRLAHRLQHDRPRTGEHAVQHRHLGHPELRSLDSATTSTPTGSAAPPAASSRSAKGSSRGRRPPRRRTTTA